MADQTSRDLSIEEALAVGVAMIGKNDHRSASQIFRGVLIHEPENLHAIAHLGCCLFEMGQANKQFYFEALYWFWRGIKLEPKSPMGLMNYGLCVSQLGHWEEGLTYLERAVALSERLGESQTIKAIRYNNLGNTLERLGRHAEALRVLDKGIACDPADGFPHYNRGIALLRLNRHREAIDALKLSLTLHDPRPDSASRLNQADTEYNLAMGQLLLGQFKDGFANYEARLLTSENDTPNLGLDPKLKWQAGDSIEGKTLLVHSEQGLGDALQSLRFLPMLQELKPKEIFLIEHAAIRNMVDLPGVTVLQPGTDITGKFDCWAALMSLPHYLGIEREEQIPAPYAPHVELDRAYPLLSRLPPHPRVAICWSGSFQHKNDKHRSIPLERFATLFDAPANFVSVQQMRPEDTHTFAELQKKHSNLSAFYLEDFRDTAAVLHSVDLVITVDTSVAHLAGSLGVPTWVLIPKFSTDWRWQLDRLDSPWYPSMRLFRQERIGDWGTTLTRVKTELAKLREAARAA